MKKTLTNMSFAQSCSELKDIVTQLEQGELELEQSLQIFERGVKLARHSQESLNKAEQKIKILLANNVEQPLDDFEKKDEL